MRTEEHYLAMSTTMLICLFGFFVSANGALMLYLAKKRKHTHQVTNGKVVAIKPGLKGNSNYEIRYDTDKKEYPLMLNGAYSFKIGDTIKVSYHRQYPFQARRHTPQSDQNFGYLIMGAGAVLFVAAFFIS